MLLHNAVEQIPEDSPSKPSLSHALCLMRRAIDEGRVALQGLRFVRDRLYDSRTGVHRPSGSIRTRRRPIPNLGFRKAAGIGASGSGTNLSDWPGSVGQRSASFRCHQHRGRGRVSAAAFYDWLFATTAAAWINGRCKPSEICIGDWRECAERRPRVSVHDSRCGAGEAPARRWKSRFRSKLRRRPAPDVGAERSFVGSAGSHRPFGTP